MLASKRHCLYMKLTPVTDMLPCYCVIKPRLRCSCVFYMLLRIWRRCIPCRMAQVLYCDGLHRPVDNDTSASVAFAVTYIIWLLMLLTAVSCHLPLPWLCGWWQVLRSVSRFNELFYVMSRQIPTVTYRFDNCCPSRFACTYTVVLFLCWPLEIGGHCHVVSCVIFVPVVLLSI